MIKDFNDINPNDFFDIIIIGSGAAGISLALELENSNFKIALIEAGNLKLDQQNQDLMKMEVDGRLKHAPVEANRVMQFGGTTNLWGGGLIKYDEIDFINRPEIKSDGWPIDYMSIEKYYKSAKKYLQLSDAEFSKNLDSKSINNLLKKSSGLEEKNLLRNRKNSNFNFMYINRFKKSKNISVYLNSTLTNINLEGKNLKFLEISHRDKRKKKLKCNNAIMCCGGIENTRLLLNFNKANGYNIGNRKGALGSYYATHINLFNGVILSPHKINNKYNNLSSRVSERRYLKFKDDYLKENNLLNLKIHFEEITNSDDLPKYSDQISFMMDSRLDRLNKYILNSQFEQTPCKNSKITLKEDIDVFGLYKAKINYDINDFDIEVYNKTYYLLALEFGIINFGKLNYKKVDEIIFKQTIGFSHHIGTTRIETKTFGGSVDSNLNVIGTNNLYCLGASCFPTSGHANPTFTIIALGIRLADYLKKENG